MIKLPPKEHFWLTNLTQADVHLSDLSVFVPARGSINLLDTKHYHLTKEQIFHSFSQGSLYRRLKLRKLVIRKFPPRPAPKKILEIDQNAMVPSRRRSAINIEEVHYEELEITDDQFAEQASDLIDQKPIK